MLDGAADWLSDLVASRMNEVAGGYGAVGIVAWRREPSGRLQCLPSPRWLLAAWCGGTTLGCQRACDGYRTE